MKQLTENVLGIQIQIQPQKPKMENVKTGLTNDNLEP